MTKQQVKEVADKAGFGEIAQKPESQDFADAASRQFSLPEDQRVPGRIIDTQGNVLGTHWDIGSFTLGQRKGLRIGGLKEPLYVIAIDPLSGDVTIGPKESLAVHGLTAGMLNWIAVEKLESSLQATARCRSRQEESKCLIHPADTGTVTVDFSQPQHSATPGQSIVFYQGEKVLGGGIIQSTHR
jgi:tRNA-specific 2-thiouridylase